MEAEMMTATRKEAVAKWREYKEAAKHSENPVYADLKKVYNQIKCGRKIIDIFETIKRGGLNDRHHPALAIAKATTKTVFCRYNSTGEVSFMNQNRGWNPLKEDLNLNPWLPPFVPEELAKKGLIGRSNWGDHQTALSQFNIQAPVPMIPPKLLPKNLTDDYYILWEVDEWKMVAPKDPWLLRRITRNLFVVLAAWDLTKLERKVIEGRMS